MFTHWEYRPTPGVKTYMDMDNMHLVGRNKNGKTTSPLFNCGAAINCAKNHELARQWDESRTTCGRYTDQEYVMV
jgi:hypothetical protein